MILPVHKRHLIVFDMQRNYYKIMTDQFKNQQLDAYKSEFYKMKSEINDLKYYNKKLLDEIKEIQKNN
jgi:predicted  nucleic acid-binding Zn-ribbon protein